MITNYSYPSFKSKLPPALPKSKNTTFDFWPEFKNLCKKEGKEKELHKLLDRLERNGDNNILALDYKPKNKYDITNYYFLLYKDTENLMIEIQKTNDNDFLVQDLLQAMNGFKMREEPFMICNREQILDL